MHFKFKINWETKIYKSLQYYKVNLKNHSASLAKSNLLLDKP